jgi:hypothetical protein
MSDQVNKEQTKDANQETITELPEGQLDEVVGGTSTLETKSPRTRMLGGQEGEEVSQKVAASDVDHF